MVKVDTGFKSIYHVKLHVGKERNFFLQDQSRCLSFSIKISKSVRKKLYESLKPVFSVKPEK